MAGAGWLVAGAGCGNWTLAAWLPDWKLETGLAGGLGLGWLAGTGLAGGLGLGWLVLASWLALAGWGWLGLASLGNWQLAAWLPGRNLDTGGWELVAGTREQELGWLVD